MISEKENTHISKFLSLVLRHQPDALGIQLDENGWTDVQYLLEQMNKKEFSISKEILNHVVASNSKKRFAFNEDGTKIRASQGHSVDIELDYKPQQPPEILYHGTAETSVVSIFKTGLEKRQRNHVHLSADIETALSVGKRYGKPVILIIAAKEMFDDKYNFFLSENKVWLTDHVPVKYLSENKAK